jgi:transcription elongation factor Elf1
MALKFVPKFGRPQCPKCDKSMLVTGGFDLDSEHKTFECLQCGHVEKPITPTKRSQAAE